MTTFGASVTADCGPFTAGCSVSASLPDSSWEECPDCDEPMEYCDCPRCGACLERLPDCECPETEGYAGGTHTPHCDEWPHFKETQ